MVVLSRALLVDEGHVPMVTLVIGSVSVGDRGAAHVDSWPSEYPSSVLYWTRQLFRMRL